MRPGVISNGISQGACSHAVNDGRLVEPGEGGVVEVSIQYFQRLLDLGSAQVQRRGHRSSPFQLEPGSRRR